MEYNRTPILRKKWIQMEPSSFHSRYLAFPSLRKKAANTYNETGFTKSRPFSTVRSNGSLMKVEWDNRMQVESWKTVLEVIVTKTKKPDWLKIRLVTGENYNELKQMMRGKTLHTVCEEARCPNIYECWANRTATFMILGDICTRACRFCAVKTGLPTELDLQEPEKVAESVEQMGLKHAVITSVARDDLQDGGASIFVQTIQAVRARSPLTSVEVLIPDFLGNWDALKAVLDATPDILNHNIETVRRMSDRVRARAKYDRSIALLAKSKEIAPKIPTKSSIMLGVGENWDEILETMDDLRSVGCDIMTIGQYLQPTEKHLTVERWYTPEEFRLLKEEGLRRGFKHVESGPLVRSSYHAHEQLESVQQHDPSMMQASHTNTYGQELPVL